MSTIVQDLEPGLYLRYKWSKYYGQPKNSGVGHWNNDDGGDLMVRFVMDIPSKTAENYPIIAAEGVKFILKGPGLLRWPDYKGANDKLSYYLAREEEVENSEFETAVAIKGVIYKTLSFDSLKEKGTDFDPKEQELELLIADSLEPGRYYLYFFYRGGRNYYGWGWNEGKGASIEYSALSYTKCKPVASFSGPNYLKPDGSSPITLNWVGSDLGGISNQVTGFSISCKFENQIYSLKESVSKDLRTTEVYLPSAVSWSNQRGKKVEFLIVVMGEAGSAWYSDAVSYSSTINQNTILNEIIINEIHFSGSSSSEQVAEVYENFSPLFSYTATGAAHGAYQFQYSFEDGGSDWRVLENGSVLIGTANQIYGQKKLDFRIYDGCEFSNVIPTNIYSIKQLNEEFLNIEIDSDKDLLKLSYTEVDYRDLPTSFVLRRESQEEGVELELVPAVEGSVATVVTSTLALIPKETITQQKDYQFFVTLKNNRAGAVSNEVSGIVREFFVKPLLISALSESFYSTIQCEVTNPDGIKELTLKQEADNFNIAWLSNSLIELRVVDEDLVVENADYDFNFAGRFDYGVTKEGHATSKALPRPKIQNFVPIFGLQGNKIDAFESLKGETRLVSLINGLSDQASKDFPTSCLVCDTIKTPFYDLILDESSDPDTNRWHFDLFSLRNWIVTSTSFEKGFCGVYEIPISMRYQSENGLVTYDSKPAKILINFEKIPNVPNYVEVGAIKNGQRMAYFQEGAELGIFLRNLPIYSHQPVDVKISLSDDGEEYRVFSRHQFNDVETIGGYFDEEGPHPQENNYYSFISPTLKELRNSYLHIKISMTVGAITEESWAIKKASTIAHTSADYILTGGRVKTIDGQRFIELQLEGSNGLPAGEYNGDLVSTQVTNQIQCNSYIIDSPENSFVYEVDEQDASVQFQIQLLYTTTISQKSYMGGQEVLVSVKEHRSNIIFIYDEAPTVAYRKNCLGINTKNPDELKQDSILVITQTTGRDKIYFIGESNEGFIDLSDGKIYNLVIDCGSW